MHRNIEMALSAAVATNGTFTVSYPAGTNKASFLKGVDHRMVALQSEMLSPKDFTIAFGDTAATITYKGTTTLPISSRVVVQLDMAKSNNVLDTDFESLESHGIEPSKIVRVQLGNPAVGDLDLLIDAATGAQLPNGTTVTSVTYTADTSGTDPQDNAARPATKLVGGELCYDLGYSRNMQAKSTGGGGTTIAATVVINGFDEYLVPMTEIITLPATSTSVTVAGLKAFRYIRSIVPTSSGVMTADTLEVGTGNAIGLPLFVGVQSQIVAEYENDVRLAQNTVPIKLPFLLDATKYAAGTSVWAEPSTIAGKVKKVVSLTQDETTGAGALTAKIATVAVDGVAVVVATGSTVGQVNSSTATAGHASTALAAGVSVEIASDGTPSAGSLSGYVLVEPNTALRGTLVVGSRATPTSATGDVRGTYTPEATLDGSVAISLDIFIDNPSYLGCEQYSA